MKLECIDDLFTPEQILKIPNRPIKGQFYTLRGRVHTLNGLGYLLIELKNPIMSNNTEQNFSARRFRQVEENENTQLIDKQSNKQTKKEII